MPPEISAILDKLSSPLLTELGIQVGLFVLAVLFFNLGEETLLFWRRENFKKTMKWVLLEINIPRETLRNPKGMEQVLAAIHALKNDPGDMGEYYRDGEVTRWFSLEMVSFGGETHLYIRLYFKYRAIVEAAFYSYYPDIELTEVPDYIERFPEDVDDLARRGYEVWGSEMLLQKDPTFPIKSYTAFESPDENKEYDPISSFLEVLSKVKKQEMVGIQFLIEAAPHDWIDHSKHIVEQLKESQSRREAVEKAKAHTSTHFPEGGPLPVFETHEAEVNQLDLFAKSLSRSPGETDVLKAVETNLSKPAFKTTIRFLYFSPRLMFYDSFARRGVVGAFNQYSALDLNGFRQNFKVGCKMSGWNWPFLFWRKRLKYRRQRLLYNYRHRKQPQLNVWAKIMSMYLLNFNWASKKEYLNVESLATLFHPPSHFALTAPHIKRVESRKAGPPAGLPIYGDEGGIDKFV